MRRILTTALLILLALSPVQAARLFVAANSDKIITSNGPNNWTNAIAVSMWVKPTTTPGVGTFTNFLSFTNGVGVQNYAFDYMNLGSATIRFTYTTSINTYVVYSKAVALTNGAWSHIVWSFDRTQNPDVCLLYVNGVAQTLTSGSGDNGAPQAGANARIGDMEWTGGGGEINFFDGTLGEIALWDNREPSNTENGFTGLTVNEITALYRGARPDRIEPGALAGDWVINGSNPERDRSVNHRDSTTITGTTVVNGPPLGPIDE